MARRRTVVAMGFAALLAGASGCGADRTSGNAADADDSRLEVFSWWGGPGSEEALNALVGHFHQKHPGIEFVNAATVDANARAVLQERLQNGDPPDTYQVNVGPELQDAARAGLIEDLTYLYDREGWSQKLPKGLLDRLSVEGKFYGVPVNIHRANMMWYSPKTLAGAGVAAAPTSWRQFLAQAPVLKAKGILPLTLGPAYNHRYMFDSLLLGELGLDTYSGLWDGTTDWQSPQVAGVLERFTQVVAYSDAKEPTGDWPAAANMVAEGKAAYVLLGDWVDAYMSVTRGLKYQVDYSAVAAPGTQSVYLLVSDCFALPKGAPHRGAAEKWLIECGSVEAQDVFNPKKGSIPARIDTDRSLYKDYSATSMAAWQDPAIKIFGGSGVNKEWNAEIDKALAPFAATGDSAAFVKTVVDAYQATR